MAIKKFDYQLKEMELSKKKSEIKKTEQKKKQKEAVSKAKEKKNLKEEYYEKSLSELGFREIGILAKLLDLWSDQKLSINARDSFGELEKFGFNSSSGNVFLIGDDGASTLMEDKGVLDLWLFTPYEGEEGFPSDFDGRSRDEFTEDDAEYLENYGSFESGVYVSKDS